MNILHVLHKDHINMNNLLILLEKNVNQIKTGMTPNFILMAEAVEFIGHYADLHHHPLEDHMYLYFSGKNKELTQLMNRCRAEHTALKITTLETLKPMSEALYDGFVPVDKVVRELELFLQVEKQHINFEEGEIFPMIEAIATVDDWLNISRKVKADGNDVLDKSDIEQYIQIYNELNESLGVV